MSLGETIGARRDEIQTLTDLDGTLEEFAQRQEVINMAEGLVDSLSAYLGAEVTPIAAGQGPELTFRTRLLFLLDGKYVVHYQVFGTYDGYDMWRVSIPKLRSRQYWDDPWGKVELTNCSIGSGEYVNDSLGLSEAAPMHRSALVERLSRTLNLHAAEDVIEGRTFLDLAVDQFVGKDGQGRTSSPYIFPYQQTLAQGREGSLESE